MNLEQGPFCPTCEDLWDRWHDEFEGCPYEGTLRAHSVELRNAMADFGEALVEGLGIYTFLDTAERVLRWIDLGTPPRDALYQALFVYWLEKHA